MDHPDDPVDPPAKNRTRTIKKKVPIPKDETGRPVLPPITRSSNLHTKTVQSVLREYCTAHIGQQFKLYHAIVSDSS